MPAASLRQLRELLGLTQDAVAHSGAGLSASRVSEVESRALGRQRVDTLSRYVERLGGELVFGIDFPGEDIVILRSPDRAPRPGETSRPGESGGAQ